MIQTNFDEVVDFISNKLRPNKLSRNKDLPQDIAPIIGIDFLKGISDIVLEKY